MAMPTLFKVAFGLIALSLILFLAGFASNYWFTSDRRNGFHFGLWAICTYSSGCLSYNKVLISTPGILGFLGAVIFIGREKSLDSSGSVNVGWSSILVIFAAIIQIISAVLIILPIRKGQVEFEQA